jgi:hypothetical protein
VFSVDGNNQSYIEAEARSRQGVPFTVASDESRSGGAFELVPSGSGSHTSVPDEGKVLWYDLRVTNGGTFTLWSLISAPGANPGSFWVSVDGGPDSQLTATPGAGWGWVKLGGTLAISSGAHTLKVKVRDEGSLIDKLLLTKSTSVTPTGLGGTAITCTP